jgi:hypothetical protein
MSIFAHSASYYGGYPGCYTNSFPVNPFETENFLVSNGGLTLESCYENCVTHGDAFMGVYSTLKSHARFRF